MTRIPSVYKSPYVKTLASGLNEVLPNPGDSGTYLIQGLHLTGGTAARTLYLLRRDCLRFNAADETLTFADNAAIEPGAAAAGDFAISFWMKYTATTPTHASFIDKFDVADDNGYKIEITSSGYLKISIDEESGTPVTCTSTFVTNDGKWHHYLILVDRSDDAGIHIYVDGTDTAGDLSGDLTDWADAVDGSDETLVVTGVDDNEILLSQFAFWKAADLSTLTPIKALYITDGMGRPVGQKFDGDETGLSVAVNLDEGVSTTAYDIMGTLNGTISNADWVTGGPPFDKGDVGDDLSCFKINADLSFTATVNLQNNYPHGILVGRNSALHVVSSGAIDLTVFYDVIPFPG